MTEQSSYALIKLRDADGATVFPCCETEEGERALAIYTSADTAEAHRIIQAPSLEARVVEGPAEELAALLLEFVVPEIEYVTLDPPIALKGGPPQGIECIPTWRFVERLMGV